MVFGYLVSLLSLNSLPPLGSFRSFASIALQVFLRRRARRRKHLYSRQTREDWEWFATPDGDKKGTPATNLGELKDDLRQSKVGQVRDNLTLHIVAQIYVWCSSQNSEYTLDTPHCHWWTFCPTIVINNQLFLSLKRRYRRKHDKLENVMCRMGHWMNEPLHVRARSLCCTTHFKWHCEITIMTALLWSPIGAMKLIMNYVTGLH